MNRREFLKWGGRGVLLAAVTPWLWSCLKRGESLTMPTLPSGDENFGFSSEDFLATLSRALARGGDFADLYFEATESQAFGLEEDRIKEAEHSIDLGCGIRTVRQESTGFSYTEELTREALFSCADTASRISQGGAKVPARRCTEVTLPNYYPLLTPPEGVAAKEKLALLEYANEVAHRMSPLVKRIDVSYADAAKRVLIVTSDGRLARDRRPMISLNCLVKVEKNGRWEVGYAAFSARAGFEALTRARVKEIAERAARYALDNLEAVTPPAGEMPVILGAGESGVLLHEAVGHGLEADYNRKGTSKYSGQLGQAVASKLCTVVDDGTVLADRGAINCDDEGNVSEKTVLIEKGVLRRYLQDRISAAYYRVPPTGNGRRQSFRHAPLPRMRVTYLAGGEHDPEEILRSTRQGIYAEAFSGGQVNLGPGDFTFMITRGFLVENGRKTAPIKDVTLIGNGPDTLSKVVMVGRDWKLSQTGWTCGKDGQSVPVGVGQPTIKISSMTVGGRKI